MSKNALLEKMLDLPEFQITDLKHNEHDIRIYVEMHLAKYFNGERIFISG